MTANLTAAHGDSIVTEPQPQPRKRRRVFMWTFLAVQALYLLWLVVGIVSAAHGVPADAHATAAAYCAGHGWQPLYTSRADCLASYGQTLTDAGGIGSTIGAALVVFLWAATDIVLGIGRLVVLTARRRRDR